jgi:hypothetical protein
MATTPSNVASLLAAAAAKRPAKAEAPAKPAPSSNLVWESVDPATLPDDMREAFFAIGRARSAFEAALTDLLAPPPHLKLAFAYKRGLAIALAPRSKQSDGLAALIAACNAAEA